MVENGERLEAPVAFNSLISGFSTWWILTAQSPQAVVYSTVCLLLQDWNFWCFLPFLYSETSQRRPEESGRVSLIFGVGGRGDCLVLFWLQDMGTICRHLLELDVIAVSGE